jgi:multiple sugar transport system ATP-binding protein
MANVKLVGIKKHFDGVKAVDGIDLEIADGEFLVLLGPSGSGKTTLMRLIAGLEKPTDGGQISIDGSVVNDLPPRERGIAMVFQSYALYPHKSVFGNISFPLSVEGMPREEIRKKVEWASGLLGIGHLLDRMPSQISGGERQRVAIARALVRRPKVLLMDEPLSNLDAKVRHTAREELKLFQREINVTTIYVTHDQAEAMGLGDRIAVLHQGTIRQIGSPESIYHDPANTFVAGFVGIPPMNFIEQDGVIIGFRPESLLPEEAGPEEECMRLRLLVERVEDLGSHRLVYGTINKTKVIASLTFRISLAEGDEHVFAVCNQDLRRFDPKTGERVRP